MIDLSSILMTTRTLEPGHGRAAAAGGEAAEAGGTDPAGEAGLAALFLLLLAQQSGATPRQPGSTASVPANWPALAGATSGEQQPLPGNGLPLTGKALPVFGEPVGRMGMPTGELAQVLAALSEPDGGIRAADALLTRGVGVESAGVLLTAAGASTPAASLTPAAPAIALASAAWQALSPGTAAFDAALGQRLVWMVGRGVQDARLQVVPEHLGPIDIRLRMDGDSAQLLLSSTQAVTRDALEQALPRLREQFADAGVQLTQADVGDGSTRHSRSGAATIDAELPRQDAEAPDPRTTPVIRHLDVPPLLDLFA
jgi:flagellar hook-length control protein FliK